MSSKVFRICLSSKATQDLFTETVVSEDRFSVYFLCDPFSENCELTSLANSRLLSTFVLREEDQWGLHSIFVIPIDSLARHLMLD